MKFVLLYIAIFFLCLLHSQPRNQLIFPVHYEYLKDNKSYNNFGIYLGKNYIPIFFDSFQYFGSSYSKTGTGNSNSLNYQLEFKDKYRFTSYPSYEDFREECNLNHFYLLKSPPHKLIVNNALESIQQIKNVVQAGNIISYYPNNFNLIYQAHFLGSFDTNQYFENLKGNYLSLYCDTCSGGQYLRTSFEFSKEKFATMFFQPHADGKKLWLIGRAKSEYQVFLIDDLQCTLISRFKHSEFPLAHISDFNNSSGWVSLQNNINSRYMVFWGNPDTSSEICQYDFYNFDNLNGTITSIKRFNEKIRYYFASKLSANRNNEPLYYRVFPYDCEFSPNDSILYSINDYIFREKRQTCFYYYKAFNTPIISSISQYLWQQDNILKNSIPIKDVGLETFTDIELMGDGKIYIGKTIDKEDGYGFEKDTSTSVLSVIEKPNSFGSNCKYNNVALNGVRRNYPVGDNYVLPVFFGRFHSLEFSKSVSCGGKAKFTIENTKNIWNNLMWIINSDTILSSESFIDYVFNKEGIYVIHVMGIHKTGYFQWYSDTINISPRYFKPELNLIYKDTIGCQWHKYDFQFDFQSKIGFPNGSYMQFYSLNDTFSFKKTNLKKGNYNTSITFNKSGKYSLFFYINNTICSDTFSKAILVEILSAVQPGALLSPQTSCAPSLINLSSKYIGDVDSTNWSSDIGHNISILNQIPTSFKFDFPGNFKIYQTQFGTSGCITRDTSKITILNGVDRQTHPSLITTTINQQNIMINWGKVPFAASYDIYRDNILVSSTTDTFFLDHQINVNLKNYRYYIIAHDICKESTLQSNIGKSIFLEVRKIANNLTILSWTPYLDWKNGVQMYRIYSIDKELKKILGFQNDTSKLFYSDNEFYVNGKVEKCYLIEAIENQGNLSYSSSNTACIPYESIIWIPTAITSNDDGINETLKISTFGIKSFTISIFNRWGAMIYETSSIDEEWKPSPEEQGVYLYVIKAITNDGNYLTKGTITVLR